MSDDGAASQVRADPSHPTQCTSEAAPDRALLRQHFQSLTARFDNQLVYCCGCHQQLRTRSATPWASTTTA